MYETYCCWSVVTSTLDPVSTGMGDRLTVCGDPLKVLENLSCPSDTTRFQISSENMMVSLVRSVEYYNQFESVCDRLTHT